jgi:hypothetical protein
MSLIAISAGTKHANFPHYLTGRQVIATAFHEYEQERENKITVKQLRAMYACVRVTGIA